MSKTAPRTPFHQSIRVRLSLVVAAIIFLAVMAASGFTAWRGFEREVETKRDLLAGAASAYAAAIADPVAKGDRGLALSTLRGVRDLPGVVQTDVRLEDGKVFAQLGTGAMLIGRDGDPTTMDAGDLWNARQLRVEMPIRKNGETIGYLGLLVDISDMRAAVFERLRVTGLSALIAILLGVAAAQWIISRMTRPLRELTSMMAAFGDDQAATIATVEAGQDETGVLAETFNTMIASIRDRDDRISRHLETLEDTVDERTRDLRLARDDAEAANAAKSDFLATMSHEIRTPMNGMLVMAEMLSSADLSMRHRRYADIIARSGKSLLTIINDILDLSKIESGKLDLEAAPVSPDAIVADVASLFWERARSKGLELTTYVSPGVPEMVIADPTRLNQVVTNLVNNALKFTEQGGVDIRVSAEADHSPDTARLIIEVEDTGIGIPADKIGHIFEPFSQADQSTTRRFGGTGLGLAVCRRLVDAMGGEISAHSTVGHGSVFRMVFDAPVETAWMPVSEPAGTFDVIGNGLQAIALEKALEDAGWQRSAAEPDILLGGSKALADLPAQTAARIVLSDIGDAQADALLRDGRAVDLLPLPFTRRDIAGLVSRVERNAFRGAGALDAGSDSAERPSFEGLSVLAADDNAVNREVLREALATLGVAVDFAENGIEAVQMASARNYDAIFMDGSMPGMDGFEATRRIRASETGRTETPMPIIALTAQVAGVDGAAWREAGADHYLTKPFTIERLVGALQGLDADAQAASSSRASSSAALLDKDTIQSMSAMGKASGRDVLGRVWALFRTKAPSAFEELVVLVSENAPSRDVARKAHALKSMALSAGASRVAAHCAGLENIAANDGAADAMETGVRTLGDALRETLSAMNAWSDRKAA